MATYIDRRESYKNRSSGSRQRFIRRHKQFIKESIEKSISNSKGFTDILSGDLSTKQRIRISRKSIEEPRLIHGYGGVVERALPGNEDMIKGDKIRKPPGQGSGDGDGRNAGDGEGQDNFQFILSKEEFLDLLFDDLDLPDLVKRNIISSSTRELVHSGLSPVGAPSNLDVISSMKNSLGRRIALKRKKIKKEIESLEIRLAALDFASKYDPATTSLVLPVAEDEKAAIRIRIEELKKKLRAIPYFDYLDVRYRQKDWEYNPTTNAVMFCIMDTSGSMTDHHKTLAKYFFMLLYLFLERNYTNVHLVFIRHTTTAREVDEKEFFHSQDSGGTVVNSAIELCDKIIKDRYNPAHWNIYVAQVSDGDSTSYDAEDCKKNLLDKILPVTQYMVYIQVDSDLTSLGDYFAGDGKPANDLWRAYLKIKDEAKNFEMSHVRRKEQIYPAFRKLFEKKGKK